MSGATREAKRKKLRESARTRQSKSKFQEMLEARKAAAGGGGGGAKQVEKGGIG